MGDADNADNPFAGISLIDAPILIFVAFHKAFRGELCELKKLAVEAVEISGGGERRLLVNAIFKRFQFFKLVYQYHCAAEDEVCLLASVVEFLISCCSATAIVKLWQLDDMYTYTCFLHSLSSWKVECDKYKFYPN